MSKRELAMMYHLMQTIPINLLGMMLVQIREAMKKVKVCLPYGILLTYIFEAFRVSFKGESSINSKAMTSIVTRPFIVWGTEGQ